MVARDTEIRVSSVGRVSVIRDAGCPLSRIKPKKTGTTATAIFRGLIDETHSQRRLPGPGLMSLAAAVTTAATASAAVAAAATSIARVPTFFSERSTT